MIADGKIFIRPIDCSFGRCAILINEVEIGRIDDIAAHQHRGALDRVLQLADIPGPSVADEPRSSIGREPLSATSSREKVLSEGNDVGDTLSQRRQMNWHHMELIEQVLPEAALTHSLVQIAMGRRDHANIDRNGPAADRCNDPLLQGP